jgi:Flp pilus assembly pilin Flp
MSRNCSEAALEVSEIPPRWRQSVLLRSAYRLIREECAEDLIEYGLLTAFIGLAGVAIVGLILTALGSGYTNWNSNTQGIWEMPDPH